MEFDIGQVNLCDMQSTYTNCLSFILSFDRDNLYSSAMAGGVVTPPMLIVFHDKYTTIDPLWHVRHLGEFT